MSPPKLAQLRRRPPPLSCGKLHQSRGHVGMEAGGEPEGRRGPLRQGGTSGHRLIEVREGQGAACHRPTSPISCRVVAMPLCRR